MLIITNDVSVTIQALYKMPSFKNIIYIHKTSGIKIFNKRMILYSTFHKYLITFYKI